MLGGASGLKKGGFDFFYLFIFYFLFLRVGVSYATCSHRGAIWLHSSQIHPTQANPICAGFPRCWVASLPTGDVLAGVLAFLESKTFPCLEMKG